MKRMLLVLTVACVMAAMLVAMAAPALAARPTYYCYDPNNPSSFTIVYAKNAHYLERQGYVCTRQ